MNSHLKNLIKEIYAGIDDGSIVNDGQLLTERELCEVYGVKRGLLQKALVALETLGIIDIRDRQGIFLINSSTKLLSDNLPFLFTHSPVLIYGQAMETRVVLEPKAASLAALACTPKWAEILESEIHYMEELNIDNSVNTEAKAERAYQHNIIMHATIIEMTGNMVLMNVYQYLSEMSNNVFAILGRTPSGFQPYALWPDLLIPEHKRIVKAIIEQKPEEAELAMYTHLKNSQQRNSSTMLARRLDLI